MKCHSNKSPGTPVAWLSEEGTAFQIKNALKDFDRKSLLCFTCSSQSVHVVHSNFIVYWKGYAQHLFLDLGLKPFNT